MIMKHNNVNSKCQFKNGMLHISKVPWWFMNWNPLHVHMIMKHNNVNSKCQFKNGRLHISKVPWWFMNWNPLHVHMIMKHRNAPLLEKSGTPVLSATPWITDSTTVQNMEINSNSIFYYNADLDTNDNYNLHSLLG